MDMDDLTPEQRGAAPSAETLRAREHQSTSRFGRWLRARSWLTILLAALATLVCIYLFGRTP